MVSLFDDFIIIIIISAGFGSMVSLFDDFVIIIIIISVGFGSMVSLFDDFGYDQHESEFNDAAAILAAQATQLSFEPKQLSLPFVRGYTTGFCADIGGDRVAWCRGQQVQGR